ncbi:Signal transduction histidine kinase [Seinonella peptonophila]|uniref:histidine kinase n=1 Tax=Seinonella peptonophila TaxID=112248 RepID=A0A1M4W683_9BACL|nr:HAMP domain-containing sensor histidine kinase [Seinonella peptonophila]SHE76603.1 Signal transduction histidine kinase [Seinonella peptonophila]
MKLFWRDHFSIILIFTIQTVMIPFIYWLDGYENFAVHGYGFLLSSISLIGLLLYRLMRLDQYYRRLDTPIKQLNEGVEQPDTTAVGEALQHLLASYYQVYQSELIQYRQKLKNHLFFITQWVHQMKTPLAVIHLITQDMVHDENESIQEELERLQKGLEMVLYATRLESFEHDFHVESIPLHQLVTKVVSENKRLFIRSHIYPEINIEPSWHVYSDEKWLTFILSQLITNAVRYSTGKGEKVHICVKAKRGKLYLEVKDQGVGIPKKDQRRVFQPFFTGKHGRTHRESTGMGLFLVKQICEKLGHQVEMESEEGIGSVFLIIFQSYTYVRGS